MTGTEVALRSGNGTLVVSDEFSEKFPAIAPNEELAELLGDALDGVELSPKRLPRVKVPSGGGVLWAVDVDGEPAAVKSLEGALAYFRKQRAFWVDPDPKGNAPDCASVDGKKPIPGGMFAADGEAASDNPGGLCRTCPMSQPGTDLKGGKGAACKDQRVLFLAEEGKVLPTVVTVPPSSVRSFEEFIVNLVNSKPIIPWWGTGIRLTLEKASNAAGNEFARIVFTATGRFSPDEAAVVRDFREYVKALVEQADPLEFVDGGAVDESKGVKVGVEAEEE